MFNSLTSKVRSIFDGSDKPVRSANTPTQAPVWRHVLTFGPEPTSSYDRQNYLPVIKEHYPELTNLRNVGQGTYGAVYIGIKDQTSCAIKLISPMCFTQDGIKKWSAECENEVAMLTQLQSNAHIIKINDYMCKKLNDRLWAIVTEKLDCDLDFMLENSKRRLTFYEVKHLARKIGLGLVFMHKKGIAHHDIKPKNIMMQRKNTNVEKMFLNDCEIKIIDFGNALKHDFPEDSEVKVKNRSGTPGYRSPEKEKVGVCNPFLSDSYSFGVVLLQLIFGKQRVSDSYYDSMEDTYHELTDPIYRKLSKNDQQFLDTIKRLLAEHEKDRCTVEEAMKYFV